MKYCKDCGRETPDGLHFCPDCGAPLDETDDRPVEPAQVLSSAELPPDKAVPKKKTDAEQSETARMQENQKSGKKARGAESGAKKSQPERKKRRMRALILAGVLVALAVAGVLVLKNTVFAAKQTPIVYVGSQGVALSDGKEDGAQSAASFSGLGAYPDAVFAADDPKKFVAAGPDGVGLFWIDAQKPENAVRITGETVNSFGISPKGDAVWYVDGDEALILHDLSRKHTLAENVAEFRFNDAFTRCAYLNGAGELYVTGLGEKDEKVLVEGDALGISLFKGETLAYTVVSDAGQNLILYNAKKQSKSVFENSAVVADVADTSSFYIRSTTADPIVAQSDPNVESDALWIVEEGNTTEYGYPAGQWYYWYSFYTEQGKSTVEGKDSAMTLAEYELYSARQAVRTLLAEMLGEKRCELLYWDGKKAETVASGLRAVLRSGEIQKDEVLLIALCSEEAAVDIDALAEPLVGQVKAMEHRGATGMSEVNLTWLGENAEQNEAQARETLLRALTGFTSYGTVRGKALTELGITDGAILKELGTPAFSVSASPDGKTLQFAVWDELNEGYTLYTMATQAGSVITEQRAELDDWMLTSWGTLGAHEESDGSLTLYDNGDKLDGGVLGESVVLARNEAAVWYIKDFDGVSGELYRWRDGKSVRIASNVHEFRLIGEERLLLIQDYKSGAGCGSLYFVRGRKDPVLLDAEVRQILTAWDETHYLCFAY